MQGKKTNLTKVALSKLLKHGLSSIIFAIAFLGVLIIANYVLAVKTSYFDVTKNKIHTLTKETENLLKEIDYNINIKAFYLSKNQTHIRTLLDLYRQKNEHITYETIDPIKNPTIAEKYEVTLPGTIIIEAPDKINRLKPPPLGEFTTEPEITMALYRLITDQAKTVYFTEGHGERSILSKEYSGLNVVHERLKGQNLIVDTINLQTTTKIPSDCSVIVIADPTSSYTDEELMTIQRYLLDGGSILMTISAGLNPNMDRIMKLYGLEFGNDFVYETASNKTTELGATSPICSIQEPSEITSNLTNQNIIFPMVRSVNIKNSGDLTITRLFASSESSWAETDLESALEINKGKRPSRNENETKGPITIAVTTEIEAVIPPVSETEEPSKKIVRSAFFGSGWFITNSIVSQFPANMNVFLNTINWITRNEKIIEVTPHAAVFTPVELTKSERRMISWLSMVIFPSVILLVGLVVWFKKR